MPYYIVEWVLTVLTILLQYALLDKITYHYDRMELN